MIKLKEELTDKPPKGRSKNKKEPRNMFACPKKCGETEGVYTYGKKAPYATIVGRH